MGAVKKPNKIMENLLFQDYSPEKRVEMLEANCLKKEDERIKRYFKEEELLEMKDSLSDLSIAENDKKEELSEISKGLKAEIKGFRDTIKGTLKNLKNKYLWNEETVYLFDDQENGLMHKYDSEGVLIESRKLLPQEKQTRIKQINKIA